MEKEISGNEEAKINLSRRDFLKLLTVGGASAVLTACGFDSENEKGIPQVALEELISHPDLYAEVPLFKTSGHPEQTGKKTVSIPAIKFVNVGKSQMVQVDWYTFETDTYKLHTTVETESPSIEFVIGGGATYFPTIPIEPGGSNLVLTDLYELTGKVAKVKVTENNEEIEKYMLQPSAIKKVEPVTLEPVE